MLDYQCTIKELRMPTSTTDFILISEIRNRFLNYLVLSPLQVSIEVLVWLQILMSGTATFCKWASHRHLSPEVWLFQSHLSVHSTLI